MKFFFPDSQDTVGPGFDFEKERHAKTRVRHRDDAYAHEVFSEIPFDGLLVSKAIVHGVEGAGKYTQAQVLRFEREGVREFFRLGELSKRLPVIGDCGAFTYVKYKEPPPEFSVDKVQEFYETARFDYGISVDHVILSYLPKADQGLISIPEEIRERQALTLDLAADFLRKHRAQRLSFEPIGVAQGWSPKSYADAVEKLQKMGYRYIALGGMVPLKTPDILACLKEIAPVKDPGTEFHLLGVTRTDHISKFAEFGVVSFDSTSPLLQAFKDEKDNYYTMDRTYSAIRIPQVEGNPGLSRKIKSGLISQDKARILEKNARRAMKDFDDGTLGIESVLAALAEYEDLYDPKHTEKHQAAYREVLTDTPWKHCPCDVCVALGHHVILFRGSERNRRRGFHNIWMFSRQLARALGTNGDSTDHPPAMLPEQKQFALFGATTGV